MSYFDNLFTSFKLLNELSTKVLGGTGTVGQNRLGKAPIIEKKSLEKKSVSRVACEVVFKEDVVLVGWKDNKGVYVASNIHNADLSESCTHYSRTEKK